MLHMPSTATLWTHHLRAMDPSLSSDTDRMFTGSLPAPRTYTLLPIACPEQHMSSITDAAQPQGIQYAEQSSCRNEAMCTLRVLSLEPDTKRRESADQATW